MNDCFIQYGYSGKLLEVDLSKNAIKLVDINPIYCHDFIGGAGYACRYLIDHLSQETGSLSAENILMIMNGPLCLTSAPSCERFVVCAKSPYTNLWGEANFGGSFGSGLKKAGFDGIIIKGKSENPVFLTIQNQDCKILEAEHLWGLGIKETREQLKKDFPSTQVKTLCIGQAGENLVKYANINAEGRSAGRTGMGTVMGSKLLKAIIVEGTEFTPKIANPVNFKQCIKKALKSILTSNITTVLRGMGTSAAIMAGYSLGDLPIKYWSKGTWSEIDKISGENLNNSMLIKNKSCNGCSIGCGRIIRIKNQNYNLPLCEGPEYETIAGFGSMLLNNDLESIAIANDMCNNYGLDTISTSSCISLLFKFFEENRLKLEENEGLDLYWGNKASLLKLIKKIAFREGIGTHLAEGSNHLGKMFGVSNEEIATVNRLEVPYHDIRYCHTMALTYAFSPRGACHTTGDTFKVLRSSVDIDFSDLGITKAEMDSTNKQAISSSIKLQDYRSLYSSLICCFFANPPPRIISELITSLFGREFNIHYIKQAGERIFNLKRLFNIKMGLNSDNDNLPSVLLRPLNEGPTRYSNVEFEKMKAKYYKLRKWDHLSGKPRESKLKSLKLDKI
jgi:aldehyde:ferredoxin oxidoreductase